MSVTVRAIGPNDPWTEGHPAYTPPRLTSLLSTGLVIGLDLPSPKTRRYLLDRFAQRHRLSGYPDALALSTNAIELTRPAPSERVAAAW